LKEQLEVIKNKEFSVNYDFSFYVYQHLLDLIRRALATLSKVNEIDDYDFGEILGTFELTTEAFADIRYGMVAKHRYEQPV
jgi:hypothetical protein